MLKGIITLIMVLIVFPVSVVMFIWKDACHSELRYEKHSPAATYNAQSFEIICTEGVPKATEVVVTNTQTNQQKSVLIYNGDANENLHWLTETSLKLHVPEEGRVAKYYSQWDKLSVAYEGGTRLDEPLRRIQTPRD